MKLTFISDTHNRHKQITLNGGDILIHSGDFTSKGYSHEVEDFVKWFDKQDYKYKVFIAGNHELTFDPRQARIDEILSTLPENIIYLENSGTIIEGLNIWGSPQQPEFHNWAFNVQRGKLYEYWNKIPLDTNILVTHGPVFGKLDISQNNGLPTGCSELTPYIDTIKPIIHVCGHIHEGYGLTYNENTTFINASICNLQYQPINLPIDITIDIQSKTIVPF